MSLSFVEEGTPKVLNVFDTKLKRLKSLFKLVHDVVISMNYYKIQIKTFL